MTANSGIASCVNALLTATSYSRSKVDVTLRERTPRGRESAISLASRRASFVCSIAMLSLLAFTPNAFGEMMHGRRLVGSSDSFGGGSGGGHGGSSDSASPGDGAIHFDFARFASPQVSSAKTSTPSHAPSQPHAAPIGFPLTRGLSLFKDLFSRALIFSSNKSTASRGPSSGSAYGSNVGHSHENDLLNWSFNSKFELNLPHFSENFHTSNHLEIVRDNHGIDFNWSHHGSFNFEINTPSFHEEFCFSDCFEINWHWQPGVGFSFSEHLAFNSHFDLQIGHFNWERDRHHDFCFGWGGHPSHHHGCGCHQPPDPPPPSAVPEPTSLALLGFGGLGMIAALGKRRRTYAEIDS